MGLRPAAMVNKIRIQEIRASSAAIRIGRVRYRASPLARVPSHHALHSLRIPLHATTAPASHHLTFSIPIPTNWSLLLLVSFTLNLPTNCPSPTLNDPILCSACVSYCSYCVPDFNLHGLSKEVSIARVAPWSSKNESSAPTVRVEPEAQ